MDTKEDYLGITDIVPDGAGAMHVYESQDGLNTFVTDSPYLLSDGQSLLAPIPIIDAGGSVWFDSDGNTFDSIPVRTLPNSTQLIPGPLDIIDDTFGNASVGGTFDLATGSMTLAVVARYDGELTGITATHGGEPLTLVRMDNIDQVMTAIFYGNGLTTESAELVVSPVGATIGPTVMRMRDDWDMGEIATDWNDGRAVQTANTGQIYLTGVAEPRKLLFARGARAITSVNNVYAYAGGQLDYGLRGQIMSGANPKQYDRLITLNSGWSEPERGVFVNADNSAGSGVTVGFDGVSGNLAARIRYRSNTTLLVKFHYGEGLVQRPSAPAGEDMTLYLFLPADPAGTAAITVITSRGATMYSMEIIEDPHTLHASIGMSVGDFENGMNFQASSSPATSQTISAFTIYDGA